METLQSLVSVQILRVLAVRPNSPKLLLTEAYYLEAENRQERRLWGRELGPALGNVALSDGLTAFPFSSFSAWAVVRTKRDKPCKAVSTSSSIRNISYDDCCGILPEHHTGTGNDFFYLQLLSQPRPGPPTPFHPSTSGSRGPLQRRQPASRAHTPSQSQPGCQS